jgi:hypothetical protein
MKEIFLSGLLFAALVCCGDKSKENPPVQPTEDDELTYNITLEEDRRTIFRNPCMGWVIYDDANGEVANAENYWAQQSRYARHAALFYIRWRWSDMEPEEGRYAWQYDDNYKKLIQGALDRGLKLCFRIYDNGQDNLRPGTPDFVRQAGAAGYMVGKLWGGTHWTPYPDDPVFQEKWANFVRAFAEEYDNPDVVDFIDGYALGWWGECHHIVLKNSSKLLNVFDWYTSLFADNFKKVLLIMPFNNEVGFATEKQIAYEGKGYGMRRDGLGSHWFTVEERGYANEMYGKTLLIGEGRQCGADVGQGTDPEYQLDTWRDSHEISIEHALTYHFNALDLRGPCETDLWVTTSPDLVDSFNISAGYRFHLAEVSLPENLSGNKEFVINHKWRNTANGYLPNNLPNWNYKYKPAFALLNSAGEVVKTWVDEKAEPSDWLAGKDYAYTMTVQLGTLAEGTYQWAVAIVDRTKENRPGIKIAIKDKPQVNGWTILEDIKIK